MSTTIERTVTTTTSPDRVFAYLAEFTFTGVARLTGPLMKPLLDRLGDRTAEQLKTTLDRL